MIAFCMSNCDKNNIIKVVSLFNHSTLSGGTDHNVFGNCGWTFEPCHWLLCVPEEGEMDLL